MVAETAVATLLLLLLAAEEEEEEVTAWGGEAEEELDLLKAEEDFPPAVAGPRAVEDLATVPAEVAVVFPPPTLFAALAVAVAGWPLLLLLLRAGAAALSLVAELEEVDVVDDVLLLAVAGADAAEAGPVEEGDITFSTVEAGPEVF